MLFSSRMLVEADAALAQIERILQSRAFRTSEAQRALLSYLADRSLDGTAHTLKEYTVGIDALGKPASYDPRQESVVRMHVGRLRQKLAEYYRTEGPDDPVIVDLPKGGFVLQFGPRAEPAAAPAPATADEKPQQFPNGNLKRWTVVLASALAAALICAVYFGVRLWSVEHPAKPDQPDLRSWTPELRQLWSPILNSNRPLVVCLATRPGSGFTGMGESTGAFLLGQFLGPLRQYVLITSSEMLSMPELALDNVIFLGPPSVSREIQAVSSGQALVLEANGIRSVAPRPGEPVFFPDLPGGEEANALVSVVPGIEGKGEVFYLAGNQTSSVTAAVQALTEPGLARSLVRSLTAATGRFPRYYQAVLKVRSMDGMPIRVSYVFHREIAGH